MIKLISISPHFAKRNNIKYYKYFHYVKEVQKLEFKKHAKKTTCIYYQNCINYLCFALLCTTSDDEMTKKNGLHLKTLLFLDI